MELIRFDSLPVSRWRNGAGRKADIASGPDWHVGFAWLDTDAPFSDFGGHDRTITLVDGPGFVLEFPDRPALQVAEPFRPAAFDGGWPTQCRLLGGPSLVLNAMTARAAYSHTVEIFHGDAAQGTAEYFMVLLAGEAQISDRHESVVLHTRDAIRTTLPVSIRTTLDSCLCRITITPGSSATPSPSGRGSG